jgi:HK97 family phage portal protein
MRTALTHGFVRLVHWLHSKYVPPGLTGSQWTGTGFIDAFKRNRNPTPNEQLAELKNTAFTCASINAAVCAAYPPRLYVATHADQPEPKCLTKRLDRWTEERLRSRPTLPAIFTKARQIKEVLDHPLLTLLRKVNPVHNSFDLWELTTFYQEVLGSAYWYLRFGVLGVPKEIWLLPAQNVTPRREPNSTRLVDFYEYRAGATSHNYRPDEIIHFRYPDPKDPYTSGLAPLRACWEQAALTSDYLAFKKATWENSAIPGALVSPDEVIGEEERDRLEAQWNAKFRRGGAGRALVTESGMKVSLLTHSMGDLAALAEYGKTKEDIANAFHVPLSFLTSETNLANLQAAEHQHMSKAIFPRLQRRDEKLNEQLVPLYDPSGRLFVASEDPVPYNQEIAWRQQEVDLKFGIVSINEVRQDRGLAPVAWGDTPWLPLTWAPSDLPKRTAYSSGRGRAKIPEGEDNPQARSGEEVTGAEPPDA